MNLEHPKLLKLSQGILLIIPVMLFIFHLTIITGLAPSKIVWIGSIDNKVKLYLLESLSLILNLILFSTALVSKKSNWQQPISRFIVIISPLLSWYMLGNTVANLFAKSFIERTLFTPIMLLLTFSVFIISRDFKNKKC